jgi:general nucleoside transport system ATP-binding protein
MAPFTMTEPILKLSGITKYFGAVAANDNICFSLKKGEVVALLGENGAGKTTLMSILFGHYVADRGEVEVFEKKLPPGSPRAALTSGVGMVHQHFTLAENMSVLDNIMLGTQSLVCLKSKKKTAEKKLSHLMEQFGLSVNPKAIVKDLSVGEQQRVEILKVLYRDAKILILDEPTAVLTPQESDSLFATIAQLVKVGLSVIFITHKLREVMAASHRCIVLRQGRVVFESKTCDTTPDALAKAMVGSDILRPIRERQIPGKEVLSLENITLVDGKGKKLLTNLNLTLRANEILGIAGVSGNGQSTLADLISGLVSNYTGKLSLDSKKLTHVSPRRMIQEGVGRIPDDRNGTGIIGDMSVMENIASVGYGEPPLSNKGLLRFSAIATLAKKLVKKFDVRCPSIKIPVRNLSGGNIQKLILARELFGSPRIILANQPTWGLDVGATAYVHTQLLTAAKQGAGVLIISEDLDELFQVADRICVIFHGRLSDPKDAHLVDRAKLGLIMSGQIASHGQDGEKNET